jgi:hypothetical protein
VKARKDGRGQLVRFKLDTDKSTDLIVSLYSPRPKIQRPLSSQADFSIYGQCPDILRFGNDCSLDKNNVAGPNLIGKTKNITWWLDSAGPHDLSKTEARQSVAAAFEEWSSRTRRFFTFDEVTKRAQADIAISAYTGKGDERGLAKVRAKHGRPVGVDIQFNEGEFWTTSETLDFADGSFVEGPTRVDPRSSFRVNILHEIGHALGWNTAAAPPLRYDPASWQMHSGWQTNVMFARGLVPHLTYEDYCPVMRSHWQSCD